MTSASNPKPITKGQIIGGDFENIIVRQKSDSPLELGELVIAESHSNTQSKLLLQVVDVFFGSQISQQNLELISGLYLEEAQPIKLFEQELRVYNLAKLKILLDLSQSKIAKQIPQQFTTIRTITADDVAFLSQKTKLSLGNLRSGSTELDLPVYLPPQKVFSHHVLISATTGKGKSNLMKHILYNNLGNCGMLVLDPHDEYYGRASQNCVAKWQNDSKLSHSDIDTSQLGISAHSDWQKKGRYYTTSNVPPGERELKISVYSLKPKHFNGILDFSNPQSELLYAYYQKYGDAWIIELLKSEDTHIVDEKQAYNENTASVVKRRLLNILDLQYRNGDFVEKGIFSTTSQAKTTISDISLALQNQQTVIIDTSNFSGVTEIFVGSILTNHIFEQYKSFKKTGELINKPVISVVIEEAPRVIGKDVLEKGTNIFATIAKEGRKFNIGICAITQLPSLIPKEILANMNTKIILGTELVAERNAIIESAAQDLSADSRNIASLDKGEAIITSNFARIATPIKIPLFEHEIVNIVHQNASNTTQPHEPKRTSQIFGR